MSKITEEQVDEKLEAFAEAMGLQWLPYSEKLVGEIEKERLPETTDTDDLTKVTKTVYRGSELVYMPGSSYRRQTRPEQKATVLGKLNAIAEFLGLEFTVSPEHVVAEKVKAVKKTAKKPVVAKKGKK